MLLAAVLVPSPAHASLLRSEATSTTDTSVAKSATVLCPDGESVLGMGGRTSDAQGNVVLSGVTVDAALTRVTARAHARPGYGGSWSVTAMAVCAPADSLSPERVVSAVGSGSATAHCQSPKILYSDGYLLTRADGNQYVHHVVPSATLSGVGVRAASTGSAALPDVIAVAVCALPLDINLRAEATTATDRTPVKNVIAPKPCTCPGEGWMFGAGAAVTGGKDVFINALTPTPGLDGARARAARAQFYGPTILAMSTSDDEEDEDWQLTGYGTFIGSWY